MRVNLTLIAECIVAYHEHHIASNPRRKVCDCWQCGMVREFVKENEARRKELLRMFVLIENGADVGEIVERLQINV